MADTMMRRGATPGRWLSAGIRTLLGEWLAYTLMFVFLYDVIWALVDFDDFLRTCDGHYIWLLIDFVYCGIFSLVSIMLNRRLFRLDRFQRGVTGYRFVLRNGFVVLVSNLLVAGACELFMNYLAPWGLVADEVWGTSFLFGVIASLMALIHLSLHYSEMVMTKTEEIAALQKKYLKLQLDPHFVFNNLSSLAGMIAERPQMAERYVVKFSHIYRYMLRHIEQDYITTSEALDFAQVYVDMLNMRHDGHIVLHIEPGRLRGCECILALSLQLLLENAVKHNRPRPDALLHIGIARQDGMLVISNNRIYTRSRNDQSVESYGIGISNLRQRYLLECGRAPQFQVTDETFVARLPLFDRQTSTHEKGIDNRG